MPLKLRNSTAWVDLKNAQVKQSSTWSQIKAIHVKDGSTWKLVWQHLIVATVSANVNDLDISTLFDSAVWTSNTPKEVVVNSGVTVGSTAPEVAALTAPANWNGTVTVRNKGKIYGAGGTQTSADGGAAINTLKAGLVVINESGGEIRGGGGCGGKGGNGGNGRYTTTTREPTSGNANVGSNYILMQPSRYNGKGIYWNNTQVSSNTGTTTVGEYTYYNAGFFEKRSYRIGTGDSGSDYWYDVHYLYRIRNVVTSTNGGAGGAGGRGQGSNHALAAGSAGANGGTNAGKGGTGGSGGNWGAAGTAGTAGENGNVSNGSPGSAGGAAGAAVTGQTRTVTNNGTISGTY